MNQLLSRYAHLSVNQAGHLTVGGADTVELAKTYGTPLYVMDEETVRRQMRTYVRAATAHFGPDALPVYASKALCFTEMYRIADSEGMGADCVSPGEIYTAVHAGFPTGKIFFHGNNKTDRDLEYAVSVGVGTVVCDNPDELRALNRICETRGVRQRVLLRITPGIDPHTHKAVSTGRVDSKFGLPIVTGQAMEEVRTALSLPFLDFAGFHCHIGSQIFDIQPFCDAASIMIRFISDVLTQTGMKTRVLSLGGGLGVPYTEDDPDVDYEDAIARMAGIIRSYCDDADIDMPAIVLEPGRSIVAAAGITLYTVGSVKTIPGFRTYVSVDGGMPDNPRYALYQSKYTALIANRAGEAQTESVTVAGRCCESGDLIGEDIKLQPAARGDVLCVLTTGAYNYSMASRYNRLPVPPVVMITDKAPRVVVRGETFENLIQNDI